MAKKSKEPRSNLKSNGESNSASASSNIFKTLFGDIPEQGTSISIFSDNNPFRRKPNDCSQTLQQQQQQEQPHQMGLGFDSLEDIGSPNGDSLNLNAGEVKKRKRKKEKIPKSNTDLDSIVEASSETPVEIKKSKKGKLESPDTKSKKGGKGKGKKSNYENSDEDYGKQPYLGVESKASSGTDQRTNPNLGVKIGGKGKELEKKKKKRKRDELETEYEEKRYGVKDEIREGRLGGGAVGEKRKTLDNPEDMLVSKDGFDDEDKLLRTVFVGNLPLKVKKKALLREFSQFGDVESVRIRSVPIVNSKTPRKGAIIKKQINDSVDSVNAYIVFKTEESARASLSHNMAVVGGNHIRVDRACPPRKKLKGENALLYDNKRTVFVGNLPFDVKDEEIYQLFSAIKNLESSVEAARVIRDPGTSVGKGIAYVLFKTRDAANFVVKKHNIKIRDRELRLSHAKSNSTPSKREISSPGERNNSPAKKLAMDSRAPYRNNTMKSTANISYQGLRASKSGVQKKVHTKITEPARLKSMTQKVQKVKGRSGKRPSVEARKANAMKGSGGSSGGGLKQGGGKRKMESRTPESARRNKKARKSRNGFG